MRLPWSSSVGHIGRLYNIVTRNHYVLHQSRAKLTAMAKQKPQAADKPEEDDAPTLRAQWKHLYHEFLPSMAKAKDPAQSQWPVVLDHCFARIVLDNVVGDGTRPWTDFIGKPAIEKMNVTQLKGAIALAEKIAHGEVDLVDLDEQSLKARGKRSKRKQAQIKDEDRDSQHGGKKRRLSETGTDITASNHVDGHKAKGNRSAQAKDGSVSSYFQPKSPRARERSSRTGDGADDVNSTKQEKSDDSQLPHFLSERSTSLNPDIADHLRRIASSTDLTPFRKQTLALLCQIPRGRWSTYGAMSTYINQVRSAGNTKTSEPVSKATCARAIGSAMKNNPFAPGVPCHRVLASGGSLGGFGGSWGEDGKYADEKKRLLREEGVKFDGRGKAMGDVFTEFRDDFDGSQGC